MTQPLAAHLSQFPDQLKRLKPQIGGGGGRYFYDTPSKSYYCLNDLVRHLVNLSIQVQDHDTTQVSLIHAALIELDRLDQTAEEQLKQATQNWSFSSCIISICTWVKRFFGNLLFDRKAAIQNLKTRFPQVQNLQPFPTPSIPSSLANPASTQQAEGSKKPISFATHGFGPPSTTQTPGFSASSSGFNSMGTSGSFNEQK